MPKLHDKIYRAIICRQNRLAMTFVDQNPVTIDRGLYKGAIQLLHHAVKFRNYRFAKNLLDRGVDVDCLDGFEQTALQDAAQRGHLGGMKWLIRHGANFEEQKDDLLLAAVRCSHPKIIKWLLEKKGCDINANRNGQTPLNHCHEYCDREKREKTEALLLKYGARLPAQCDPGSTDKSPPDE